MWQSVGLFREREGLERAVAALEAASASEFSADAAGARHRNLVTVARLIARAALRREESRGGHFRSDYPGRDDSRWRIHVVDERATASETSTASETRTPRRTKDTKEKPLQ
jgi:L-aspartate oxidase